MSAHGLPIGGWSRCVHEAAAFDSREEYEAAIILDGASVVRWWLRNDPVVFRIPTPIGPLEVDFVYLAERDGRLVHGALEVKGGFLWNGPGSEARVKAKAAAEWARVATVAYPDGPWEFAEILDQDVSSSRTLEELLGRAIEAWPR